MNAQLKTLKDIHTEGCVTLVLNTHRTKPDNLKDGITLKNLVTEAEQRLLGQFDKRFAESIMNKLNEVIEEIDHNYNLESLVLFANSEMADYVRLPIAVENRVIIDNTFATRDLVRAMHQDVSYYVLVLSRQGARLIEAHTDKVVRELRELFPIKNRLWTTSKKKQSMAAGSDVLIEEFFNRVDKAMNAMTSENPLPVYLATESRNFDHYMAVADNKDRIAGHINQNRGDEKAHHIVSAIWPQIQEETQKSQQARITELKQAVSQNKCVSDLNEIWNALHDGKGQTLFVKKDYFQQATVDEEGNVYPVNGELPKNKVIIDDLVDEMVEVNLANGGDNVFIAGDELDNFQDIALVTRY